MFSPIHLAFDLAIYILYILFSSKMSVSGAISFIYNALPLGRQQASKTRALYTPDLFAGILSGEPERNPHETGVGPRSEAWTKE